MVETKMGNKLTMDGTWIRYGWEISQTCGAFCALCKQFLIQIRLVRQAAEWGSSYRFWSCADVNIINTNDR